MGVLRTSSGIWALLVEISTLSELRKLYLYPHHIWLNFSVRVLTKNLWSLVNRLSQLFNKKSVEAKVDNPSKSEGIWVSQFKQVFRFDEFTFCCGDLWNCHSFLSRILSYKIFSIFNEKNPFIILSGCDLEYIFVDILSHFIKIRFAFSWMPIRGFVRQSNFVEYCTIAYYVQWWLQENGLLVPLWHSFWKYKIDYIQCFVKAIRPV